MQLDLTFLFVCKYTLCFAYMQQRDERIVRKTNVEGFPVKESGAAIHSNLVSHGVHEGMLWQ